MNTATFDTLSAARSLEAAGIESKQAEAIVGRYPVQWGSLGHKDRPAGLNQRIAG